MTTQPPFASTRALPNASAPAAPRSALDATEAVAQSYCICGGQHRFHTITPDWTTCSHLPFPFTCKCEQFVPTTLARTILGEVGGWLNCVGCGAFAPVEMIEALPYCATCVRERVPASDSTRERQSDALRKADQERGSDGPDGNNDAVGDISVRAPYGASALGAPLSRGVEDEPTFEDITQDAIRHGRRDGG